MAGDLGQLHGAVRGGAGVMGLIVRFIPSGSPANGASDISAGIWGHRLCGFRPPGINFKVANARALRHREELTWLPMRGWMAPSVFPAAVDSDSPAAIKDLALEPKPAGGQSLFRPGARFITHTPNIPPCH